MCLLPGASDSLHGLEVGIGGFLVQTESCCRVMSPCPAPVNQILTFRYWFSTRLHRCIFRVDSTGVGIEKQIQSRALGIRISLRNPTSPQHRRSRYTEVSHLNFNTFSLCGDPVCESVFVMTHGRERSLQRISEGLCALVT